MTPSSSKKLKDGALPKAEELFVVVVEPVGTVKKP
jgi:hypothetical protein